MMKNLLILITLLAISGCLSPDKSGRSSLPVVKKDEQRQPQLNAGAHVVQEEKTTESIEPPFEDRKQEMQFYLSKLSDRDYTQTYGHGYTWYTAAEELGQIGEPAIPHLIQKLDTNDPFELKLTLYALLLASQDPAVKAKTGGEYIQVDTVLSEESNTENKKIALSWWKKYRAVLLDF